MVMHGGKIEQIGTPMELYEDPATPFVADFIGQSTSSKGRSNPPTRRATAS